MFRFLTRRWRLALALVLAAVTLTIAAFWFQSWRAQREFEATVAMIEGKGGNVGVYSKSPPWKRQLKQNLGIGYFQALDEPDVRVELRHTQLSAAELKRITAIAGLRVLAVCDSTVDAEGFAGLREAKWLVQLDVHGTNVTDQHLRHVEDLRSLRFVNFSDTAVTDERVELLAHLPSMGRISVGGAKVNAVEPIELKVDSAAESSPPRIGDERIIRGRFYVRGSQTLLQPVYVSVLPEQVGSIQPPHLTGTARATQNSASEYSFEVRLKEPASLVSASGKGLQAGRHIVSAYVSCSHGTADVSYRLGKVELSLEPALPTK